MNASTLQVSGSSAQRILTIARHDLRILRRDPVFLLIFTLMPLGFMAFTKGAFGAAMGIRYANPAVNGASQVVPGAAVLFSGFLVGNLGFAVFREHAWATWERLRASHLETWELMIGKSIAPVLSLAVQLTVMLGVGGLLFDLHVRGSLPAFLVIAAMLAVMEVALGFMLLSICRSILQLNAATNLGAMLLGGIGGAVTPFYLLPTWAQRIAPGTPAYWAMRGFPAVVIDGGGFSSIALPVVVLAAFSIGFTVVAAMRFPAVWARTANAASSAVLPMPGSPVITTVRRPDAETSAKSPRSTSSPRSTPRPRSAGSTTAPPRCSRSRRRGFAGTVRSTASARRGSAKRRSSAGPAVSGVGSRRSTRSPGSALGKDLQRVETHAVVQHCRSRAGRSHRLVEELHARGFDDHADAVGSRRVHERPGRDPERAEDLAPLRRFEPAVDIVDLVQDHHRPHRRASGPGCCRAR